MSFLDIFNVCQEDRIFAACSAEIVFACGEVGVIIVRFRPLVMIGSLIFIFFTIGLKEEYKFQQPSLKTKLFDIQQIKYESPLPYVQLIGGIKYLQINGVMNNECLLITFPTSIDEFDEIKTVYSTLIEQQHLSKNVVLLSYSNVEKLNQFFNWYYNNNKNIKLSFGIIRAGLNIQIHNKELSQTKDKAYLKMYSTTLHPDSDYFLSIKQLLESISVSYSPCEQIQHSRSLRYIKRAVVSLEQAVTRKDSQMRLFYDYVLCELHEHLQYALTAHQIMMKNGFQAATIKFLSGSLNQSKLEKLIISFVNQFGMQQDHLHSSNTHFYPLSKTYFAPLMLYLWPSLVFFIALVVHLVDHFIKFNYQNTIKVNISLFTIGNIAVWEYYFNENYTWTLIFASFAFVLSIFSSFKAGFSNTSIKQQLISKNYEQICLLAFLGLMSIYFGVFCFSLSIITMTLSLLMLVKPQNKIILGMVKIIISLLTLYIFNLYDSLSWQLMFKWIQGISCELKLCLLIATIYYTI